MASIVEEEEKEMEAPGCLEIECNVLEKTYNNQTVLMASIIPVKDRCFKCTRRREIDLVAVIDCSGSMSGEKMLLVQEALQFVVQQLSEKDRLCIIGFANEAAVVLPLTEMKIDGKKLAIHQIKTLLASGGSNMSAGLFCAMDELEQRTKSQARPISSVILLTDGLSNRGVLDSSRLVTGLDSYSERMQSPPSIFTFGVGNSHDPRDLSAVAREGGVYKYLQDADEIPFSFETCLGGLFSIVAQNIKLTFNPNHVAVYDPEHRSRIRQNDVADKRTINLGDLYTDERKDMIFVVKPTAPKEAKQINFELSYFDVVKLTPQVTHQFAKANVEETETVVRALSSCNRVLAVGAMKTVAQGGDKGKPVLEDSIKQLKDSQAYLLGDALTSELVQNLEVMASHTCPSNHVIYSLSNQYGSQRVVSTPLEHGQNDNIQEPKAMTASPVQFVPFNTMSSVSYTAVPRPMQQPYFPKSEQQSDLLQSLDSTQLTAFLESTTKPKAGSCDTFSPIMSPEPASTMGGENSLGESSSAMLLPKAGNDTPKRKSLVSNLYTKLRLSSRTLNK